MAGEEAKAKESDVISNNVVSINIFFIFVGQIKNPILERIGFNLV
jgi:hypothetical protein